MLDKFQVVKGFEGAEVQIVKGGKLRRIDLGTATNEQLEYLQKIKHPAVKAVKPKPSKTPKEK
jgi:hypothetical protein